MKNVQVVISAIQEAFKRHSTPVMNENWGT